MIDEKCDAYHTHMIAYAKHYYYFKHLNKTIKYCDHCEYMSSQLENAIKISKEQYIKYAALF